MEAKQKSPILRIWGQAKSRHGMLGWSVVLSLLGVLCGFVPYYCAARIITLLVGGGATMALFTPYLWGALIGFVGKTVLTMASTSVSHAATFAVLADIRKRCLSKLANLSMGTLQQQSVGRWKTILVDQIESMEKTLAHLLPEMTGNLGAALILLIALFFVDWRMALLSLVTLPLGFMFMMSTMASYSKNYAESVRISKDMNDAIVEYISGVKVIKAFNQSDKSYARYVDSINKNASFFYGWMKRCEVGMACGRTICPAVLLSVIPFGLLFFMHGSITGTELLTVIILSMSLVAPLVKCMNFVDSLATTGTIIESVETILNAPEQKHPIQRVKLNGYGIEMKDVRFSYADANGEVLHGVNLKIEPGTKNALVGPSGGGKSTIAKLIASFWDVESGSVSMGGENLKDIPLTQISDNIAYVSQDNFLFNDTVRNNIRMGRENATDGEVEEIARKAGCYDFIMTLDNGFETKVGGGGAHLSGGERQRIAIARAMLKDAPIVILDEATAYIDPENEAILQDAIGALVKGKTLIVIAHRLRTVTNSHQIAVVSDGTIAAAGTHTQLIKDCELYRHMWEANNDRDEEVQL